MEGRKESNTFNLDIFEKSGKKSRILIEIKGTIKKKGNAVLEKNSESLSI